MKRRSMVGAIDLNAPEPGSPPPQSARQALIDCIQEQSTPLLGTIRAYVARSGLATGTEVRSIADEILQETVVEALAHADAYILTRQPLAWLLGIALNMVRRRRVLQAKQISRELPLSRLAMQYGDDNENDLLERLVGSKSISLEQEIEMRSQVEALLALVSQEDQQLLLLALQEDFKREGLARRLKLNPNTARMRLSRALGRLRLALEKHSSFL